MAFALMLHFARANTDATGEKPLRCQQHLAQPKRLCCYSFKCFRLFKAFFSKIVSKASGITKSARISTLSKKSFIGH